MWFCLLPRSQFPLKPHSNMKKNAFDGKLLQQTHHSQCMEFLMQFWWMTIFFWGCINIPGACMRAEQFVYGIRHGFMPKFWLSCNRKTSRQLFSIFSLAHLAWLMVINVTDAILKLRWRAFFIFVIYWLSNYRAAGAIKKTYIYLLNFINENYKH